MLAVYIILVFLQLCTAKVFNRGQDAANAKLSLSIVLKDEEIQTLSSELQSYRVSNRILTDQLVFFRGIVTYHKRAASEARRDKETLRRVLISQMEDLMASHEEKLNVVREEMSVKNEKVVEELKSSFETAKEELVSSMKAEHAKEVKDIKRDFRIKLEEQEEQSELSIADLKTRLREEKSKSAKFDEYKVPVVKKEKELNDLRKSLSSATAGKSEKSTMPSRRPRSQQ